MWSHLVLKEAFLGTQRFQDFQTRLGIPRQTLVHRLGRFSDDAIFYKRPMIKRRGSFEYILTPKGRDLYWYTLLVWRWHRKWQPDAKNLPETLVHRTCGQRMTPVYACKICGEEPAKQSIFVSKINGHAGFATNNTRRRSRISGQLEALSTDYAVGAIMADAWALLVLTAVIEGATRFSEIQTQVSISSKVLAARLKVLVHLAMLENRSDYDRSIYTTTPRGMGVYAAIIELRGWGDRWLAGSSGPSETYTHTPCGSYAHFRMLCDTCNQVIKAEDVLLQ